MPAPPLNIRRIDTRDGDVEAQLDALRLRLSPRGNVVSGYTCGGDDLEADLIAMGAVAFFTAL